MIKITYEINKNGVASKLEAAYESYEQLNEERNSLVNSVIFAFNDISKKTGTVNTPAVKKAEIKENIDGPATQPQLNYLVKLGYDGDMNLSYSQANEIIRNLKNSKF